MPFKVTALRLETIADVLFILGLLAGILILILGGIIGGIVCLFSTFLLSYVLYAIAKILQNTENILEYLKDPRYLKNHTTEPEEETDENE